MGFLTIFKTLLPVVGEILVNVSKNKTKESEYLTENLKDKLENVKQVEITNESVEKKMKLMNDRVKELENKLKKFL